jgi:Fe-S cluster biogenesis protein NfuA
MKEITISLEFTPNPNTLKYVVDVTLLERGAVSFANKESTAGKSLLAAKLFDVLGVNGVMIGKNFVTITKGPEGDWESLNNGVNAVLKDHLGTDQPVLDPSADISTTHAGQGASDIEEKIRDILDRDIRPAVAMDGGDITFERFEDGIVYLHMQGSCSGCPSSTATLKMGIETRLKDAIPEVSEVVAI